ncbi:AcrR family transcriptional regulator [Arthrobacter pigmenti]|uniref:AcrR family transcriptional regulator n=1 Tax=Arthrobacter pigmenti TaxID=271432 RepID=A0A846RSM5_9MICC|nr:TetR/AcrR family transcriptional regulator [Arthrobacter pigmenti]NJC22675.1 AcrR family transcriptional regulator [Arthrobacter pigmenti]
MPKLWTETVEGHRHAVRTAVLDAVAALVAETGFSGVSMTRVAGYAGVTRATLYKYFPDVESLLAAWHERQVREHLAGLEGIGRETAGTGRQLQAVLEAYALMIYDRPGHDTSTPVLHQGSHIDHAHQHLEAFIADLIRADAQEKAADLAMDPTDLARYCIKALSSAGSLSSRGAVSSLVAVTVRGLHT